MVWCQLRQQLAQATREQAELTKQLRDLVPAVDCCSLLLLLLLLMLLLILVAVVVATVMLIILLHSCLMPGFMSHVPLGPDRAVRARSSRSQPSVAGNGSLSLVARAPYLLQSLSIPVRRHTDCMLTHCCIAVHACDCEPVDGEGAVGGGAAAGACHS